MAFDTHAWLTENAPDNYESWPDALIKLSQSGHLDRQRLLDASLDGLSQDLKQNQLSGIHKFHKLLKPDQAERCARQDEYLALLGHKVGHVCKFALDMLGAMEKDGGLDIATFASEAQAIFTNDGKGNAVAALKLLKRLLKNAPDHADAVLRSVAEALQHANADVQEQAIATLTNHKSQPSEDLKQTIAGYAGFVSVTLHTALDDLTGEPAEGPGEDLDDAPDEAEIADAMAGVSAASKRALRIDEILWLSYLPISQNFLDHAILPASEPIEPVNDVDELIALAAHTVEVVESPDVIEQVVDGISR